VPPREAARLSVTFGTYPGAFALRDDPERWAAYVRDAIAEPAIGRDLLHLEVVRRPALLRQIFGLAVASPAQIVALKKLQGQLADPGALATIAHYLALLGEAYLIAPLEKHAATALRRRAAPPKLVTLNNALTTALAEGGPPEPARDPTRFGRWLENACLAHAVNRGQRVRYWREEPLEVDAVLEGSWGRWAIEVKSGPVDVADLRGLLEFTRRFPRFQPLVVCDDAARGAAQRAGLSAIAWEDFLLAGPAS
jgi:predicted AAA+ superfamily ATPase